MRQHARVTSLLVLAALLGGGCAEADVRPDPSDPPAEPQVWLPDDGLPVPASVANRAPLRWCGVEIVVEGDRRTGDQRQSSHCVLAALGTGGSAEMAVHSRDPRTGRSILFIVRARAPGEAEVVTRSTAPGLPPLWELERCTGATDRRFNDELGGRVFGDLLLPDCGVLTRIVD